MKYAKLISESSIDINVPTIATIGGRPWVGQLPKSYLSSLNFYPFDEIPKPSENPNEGYHWEARYSNQNNRIVRSWIQVENPPPPPRSFSKIKLKMAIAKFGLLSAFETMLRNIEIEPGYTALDAWNDAQIIKNDFDGFDEMLTGIKTTLNVSDEVINQILAAAEVE